MRNLSVSLYIINLALLATHQADAAFWHEWELFGIAGGAPMFLLLNFILMTIFLHGFRQLLARIPSGHTYAGAMAAIGILAFVIHVFHMARGGFAFTPPSSVSLLVMIVMVSVAQLVVAVKESREQKRAQNGSPADARGDSGLA